MRLVETIGELRAEVAEQRRAGAGVGLVPTMGALHAGHASLVERARDRHALVLASIFVNPLQFERPDDLERYPRDLERDLALLERSGAQVCFAPVAKEMYPDGGPIVSVDPGTIGATLEGVSRPGHLSGVATVVAKLLCIATPDAAYFGEKDFQQLVLVRRLVRDLSMPVDVVGCATVREPDGLATSSRNARLSVAGRAAATVLHRALLAGSAAWRAGRGPGGAETVAAQEVRAEPLATLDYTAAVDDRLTRLAAPAPVTGVTGPFRLLVAATVDGVRLVDNVEVPS